MSREEYYTDVIQDFMDLRGNRRYLIYYHDIAHFILCHFTLSGSLVVDNSVYYLLSLLLLLLIVFITLIFIEHELASAKEITLNLRSCAFRLADEAHSLHVKALLEKEAWFREQEEEVGLVSSVAWDGQEIEGRGVVSSAGAEADRASRRATAQRHTLQSELLRIGSDLSSSVNMDLSVREFDKLTLSDGQGGGLSINTADKPSSLSTSSTSSPSTTLRAAESSTLRSPKPVSFVYNQGISKAEQQSSSPSTLHRADLGSTEEPPEYGEMLAEAVHLFHKSISLMGEYGRSRRRYEKVSYIIFRHTVAKF